MHGIYTKSNMAHSSIFTIAVAVTQQPLGVSVPPYVVRRVLHRLLLLLYPLAILVTLLDAVGLRHPRPLHTQPIPLDKEGCQQEGSPTNGTHKGSSVHGHIDPIRVGLGGVLIAECGTDLVRYLQMGVREQEWQ